MSITISVHEAACRVCGLCVEKCPTRVLRLDAGDSCVRIGCLEDCIGCLSCSYVCPSGALLHAGVPLVRNFYRDVRSCERLARYL
jgi:NAD-dependent dihydropyrimidine dehydrogenase PreA subunit